MSARDAVNVSDQSYEVDGAPGSTVLCLFDCDRPESVAAIIEGLSPAVSARLSEVLVVHQNAVAWPGDQESVLANASSVPIKFHRNPRDYDYGDARKAAFEYVLAQGFSHVVCLRAGKRHPVELLGDLLDARDAYPRDLIIASRPRSGASDDSGTAPDATAQDRRMGTRLHERILKLGMTDYQSSYRIYPTAALD